LRIVTGFAVVGNGFTFCILRFLKAFLEAPFILTFGKNSKFFHYVVWLANIHFFLESWLGPKKQGFSQKSNENYVFCEFIH
jgi:hypothetical protein